MEISKQGRSYIKTVLTCYPGWKRGFTDESTGGYGKWPK